MVNAPETRKERHVSTGRGGAANFKKASTMAKKSSATAPAINSQRADFDSESELALTRIATQASLGARFATGRGGAGNILPTGQAPLPAQTQPLSARPRPNISTGRGGAGNFRDAKTGRSFSEGGSSEDGKQQRSRPIWAGRVPKIDAGMDDESAVEMERVQSRTGSFNSARTAPAGFFGKMRRRLSSFGTNLEP